MRVYILQVETVNPGEPYGIPGNPFTTIGVYTSLTRAKTATGWTREDSWEEITDPVYGPGEWWQATAETSSGPVTYRIEEQEVIT